MTSLRGRVALDERGRVSAVELVAPDPSTGAEHLCSLLGDLLATRLTPVGLDLEPVRGGHVAILSLRETPDSGPVVFHAGTALAPDPVGALGQAGCEALLRDAAGSALVGGAERLVAARHTPSAVVQTGEASLTLGAPLDDGPTVTVTLADARVTVRVGGTPEAPDVPVAVARWSAAVRAASVATTGA